MFICDGFLLLTVSVSVSVSVIGVIAERRSSQKSVHTRNFGIIY